MSDKSRYEVIKAAAEILLAAGFMLGAEDFAGDGLYFLSTPDAAVEYVAKFDRDQHEYVLKNLKRIADAQKNGEAR